jgi:hypothetical protein
MINIDASRHELHWNVRISCDVVGCYSQESYELKTTIPTTHIAYDEFERKGWKRSYPIPTESSIFSSASDVRAGDICPNCRRNIEGTRDDDTIIY